MRHFTLRSSDFLTDREFDALNSTRIDRDLFLIGVVSLLLTSVLSIGFLAV